ncbi:hypothetical protein Tco_0405597 [Tanacetum coccineum]
MVISTHHVSCNKELIWSSIPMEFTLSSAKGLTSPEQALKVDQWTYTFPGGQRTDYSRVNGLTGNETSNPFKISMIHRSQELTTSYKLLKNIAAEDKMRQT